MDSMRRGKEGKMDGMAARHLSALNLWRRIQSEFLRKRALDFHKLSAKKVFQGRMRKKKKTDYSADKYHEMNNRYGISAWARYARSLSDQEMLQLHDQTHRLYVAYKHLPKLQKYVEMLTLRHAQIVQELLDRDIPHDSPLCVEKKGGEK